VVYGASTAELDHLAPSRFFVEGLGPDLEAECPVVWHGVGVPWAPGEEGAGRLRAALGPRPYVTVRDPHSARRLAEAGVDRPVEVVPDSALLIDRLMPPDSLAARLDRLRAVGGYPGPETAALVVQGCDLMAPHLPAVAESLRAWNSARPVPLEIVVVETGRCRGDSAFAAGLEAALAPGRVWRLPAGVPVEDLAAAVAGAAVFLGSSLHGAITALAYGRSFVLLNLFGDNKLDGFGDLTGLGSAVLHSADGIPAALDAALARPADPAGLAALQARIDRHFDRIAEMAAERAAARPDVGPVVDLAAYAVADHVARLGAETAALREELAAVRAGAARAEAELSALQATRTFRLLGPARDLYSRLRRSSWVP
ncbi:MAG TPA: polysaccharide pyruvyl transferase family protein, partial [Acidimicrobiia bacterium]|nr:polysaccharide pyruvyl transferase family protein [Acidimicrobiia bacterium]